MFEIMESRVLAILLSTFPVMAFITEKATGIIATQLRLPCKRDKGKNGEVKIIAAIGNIAFDEFFEKEVLQKI